jgi:hypothetical protein
VARAALKKERAMGWFIAAVLCQEWSPLRSFDVAARDFFSSSTSDRLGATLDLWDADAQGFDFSLAVFPKVPFAPCREPYRGELTEIALAAGARIPAGDVDIQFQLGASFPHVADDIFAREPDVELSSFAFAGAGFTWRVGDAVALGFQLEANTCAFRDVDLLQRHPASAVFGVHARRGALVFDAGLGTGFDRIAGYPWMAYVSIGVRF